MEPVSILQQRGFLRSCASFVTLRSGKIYVKKEEGNFWSEAEELTICITYSSKGSSGISSGLSEFMCLLRL